MKYKFEGSKLEESRGLSTTEIAKLVRAEIKATKKSGELPADLHVSVRSRYFSGGSSITITWSTWGVFEIEEDSKWANYSSGYYPILSAKGNHIIHKLNDFVNAYNFDDSDAMTDYYHVRFYGSVDWDWQSELDKSAARFTHETLTGCNAQVLAKLIQQGEHSILAHAIARDPEGADNAEMVAWARQEFYGRNAYAKEIWATAKEIWAPKEALAALVAV